MFTSLTKFSQWSRSALAVATLPLLSGCDLNFWRMEGHQSTITVEGVVAREQLQLFYITCWVSLIIFLLVGGVLAYATFKFRARSAADEHSEPPPQGHGNPLIELGLIGASVLALVVIAVPTMQGIWSTYDVPEAEKKDALQITCTGNQWWFKFEYPSELAPINNAGAKAPLITANELIIPAGRAVRVNLRTVDVIHSFWLPKLAGKVDMIPNRANHIYIRADHPGYYWGQCAEYCGDSHAVMRFRVIALDQKEYAEWLEQQSQLARTLAPRPTDATQAKAQFASLRSFKQNETGVTDKFEINPLESWRAKQSPEKNEDAALIATGRQLFSAKACLACHNIRGHDAPGITGPDLTHIGSRTTIAGGLLENNSEQLRRWIHNPGAVKPGNKMALAYARMGQDGKPIDGIKLTGDEEVALVAYLESLK
jgi:cytochrome c oxidase subunit II